MRANTGLGALTCCCFSMRCLSAGVGGGGRDTISGVSHQQDDFCPFHTTFRVIGSLDSHL